MKRVYVFVLTLLMSGSMCFPKHISDQIHKTNTEDIDDYRFSVDLNGGIYINNNAAWILEPSVTWNFYKYIGVNIALEFTSEYNQPRPGISIDGWHGDLNKNYTNVGWVILKPGLVFKTPSFLKSREGTRKLWLQAEPGVSLACPFHNSVVYNMQGYQGNTSTTIAYKKFRNEDLQCFYWQGKVSINFSIDRFMLGGGYGISNFDYYSCRRNIKLPDGRKFQVPEREMSHSVFLSVGYNF